MSMTFTQVILIILSVAAIVWGIYTLVSSMRKKNHDSSPSLLAGSAEHDKDGLPILPRHQRPKLPDDPTFKAEITPENPTGTAKLSAVNTELSLDPKSQQNSKASSLHNEGALSSRTTTYGIDDSNKATTANDGEDAFSLLANATETIAPVVHTFDETQLKKDGFSDTSPILDTHIQAQIDEEQNSPLNNATQNINITLYPNQKFARISGKDLLKLVDRYGMKYGAMNMFHRYENKDGTGLLWFSMMMINDDGIMPFDLNKLPEQYLNGLVLFLSLPHPKAVKGFDSMMSTASLLAHDLNASIYDETNAPINKENTQAMREIALNFGK